MAVSSTRRQVCTKCKTHVTFCPFLYVILYKSSQFLLCTFCEQPASSISLWDLQGNSKKSLYINYLISFSNDRHEFNGGSTRANFKKPPFNSCLCLPSSPPEIEKSRGKMVHFCIFCALDMALAFTLSTPSWMAWCTADSFRVVISDMRVATTPWHLQKSTISGDSSSVGFPDSSTAHWKRNVSNTAAKMIERGTDHQITTTAPSSKSSMLFCHGSKLRTV